ncbi:hypothetical protein QTP70_002823 [Hemibagrus guttatus]|uniref:Uncharacterized protein n=1 Tax=Hemibagrus guttatus TaxID=175788 RepID=A0AAE0QRX5_9TELE|nr:hypothetical protein QTP70_002823 [Hemibagrus guttatus]
MDRTEENRQEYKELQRRVKREVSKAKQKAYDKLAEGNEPVQGQRIFTTGQICLHFLHKSQQNTLMIAFTCQTLLEAPSQNSSRSAHVPVGASPHQLVSREGRCPISWLTEESSGLDFVVFGNFVFLPALAPLMFPWGHCPTIWFSVENAAPLLGNGGEFWPGVFGFCGFWKFFCRPAPLRSGFGEGRCFASWIFVNDVTSLLVRWRRVPAVSGSRPPALWGVPGTSETKIFTRCGRSSVDVARRECSAVDVARRCDSAVDVARPCGSAVDVARLCCSTVDVAWGPPALPSGPVLPPPVLLLLLAPPTCLTLILVPPTCFAFGSRFPPLASPLLLAPPHLPRHASHSPHRPLYVPRSFSGLMTCPDSRRVAVWRVGSRAVERGEMLQAAGPRHVWLLLGWFHTVSGESYSARPKPLYHEVQRVPGLMLAAANVIPLGLLHMRPFQLWLRGASFHPHRHPLSAIRVNHRGLRTLLMWKRPRFRTLGPKLWACHFHKTLSMDTSLSGWGAVLDGLRSHPLFRLAQQILLWAETVFLLLKAIFIPGHIHWDADFLSRQVLRPREWHLHPQVVESIWHILGHVEVDLFASKESTHCPLWYSLPHPAPLGLDALVQTWPRLRLYVFPLVAQKS